MINPIDIAINSGTNRKQVPNIIGSRTSNIKKIITSVAQIFDFFLVSILNYFSSTYLLQSEQPQSLHAQGVQVHQLFYIFQCIQHV